MDERAWNGVRVAGRIWRFQREQIKPGSSGSVTLQNQEKHHRKMTFEDEFVGLLKKYGIEFDPRYVFG
jgi:hypothetical protein